MSCGCAERMRQYVLPSIGFQLVNGEWVNENFAEPSLRRIPDSKLEAHHFILTLRIVKEYSKDKFLNWFSSVWQDNLSDNQYSYLVEQAVGRFDDAYKGEVDNLPMEEQTIWMMKTHILPVMGYIKKDDWWIRSDHIFGLPDVVTQSMIGEMKNYLGYLIHTMGQQRFLDWWNVRCPLVLKFDNEDCRYMLDKWYRHEKLLSHDE